MNLVKLNNENEVLVNKINEFNSPKEVFIPIYINSTFKANEYIYKNNLYGGSISPISGHIKSTKLLRINNQNISSIVVENDYKENSKTKKKCKIINSIDDFLDNLEKFHYYKVLNRIEDIKNIKHLVISSIDEEGDAKEFIRLTNNYDEILEISSELSNIFALKEIVLAIKSTNFNSIKNVKSNIGMYPEINLTLIPDLYLIGYKKYLCEYLNIKPSDTLVLTVNEIYNIYNILKKNKDVTENLITIRGNALNKNLVINTRLYTPLSIIIDEYFKIIYKNYNVFVNGPLRGYKDSLDNVVITEDIDSIVINVDDEESETRCINCGACTNICPEHIEVKRDYKKGIKNRRCIGCGLCDYICPAKIKLRDVLRGVKNEKI